MRAFTSLLAGVDGGVGDSGAPSRGINCGRQRKIRDGEKFGRGDSLDRGGWGGTGTSGPKVEGFGAMRRRGSAESERCGRVPTRISLWRLGQVFPATTCMRSLRASSKGKGAGALAGAPRSGALPLEGCGIWLRVATEAMVLGLVEVAPPK